MIQINSKNTLMEQCRVMAMIKIADEDSPKNGKIQTSLGEYIAVDITNLKREIKEKVSLEEPLIYLMDVALSTGKTRFSGYFVHKAQEVCELMGWDYNFTIYESIEGDKPVILINEDNIGFIIAPKR